MADQQPPPPSPAGAGGQPGGGAPPPRERRRGCGRTALLAVAAVVLVVVIVVVSTSAGEDDGDSTTASSATSEDTATPGTTASAGTTAAPSGPPAVQGDEDEVDDVTLERCENEFDIAVATGSIANDSSKASTYFIELNVLDADGTVVGNAFTTVDDVPAGGRATWEAPSTSALPAGGQCVLTSVERMGA